MSPNQIYFYRNRGPWNWEIHFELKSWRELWQASIPIFSKLSLSIFLIAQRVIGPFRMWTNVNFQEGESVVHHSTKILKCGIPVYKSEKKFMRLEDGNGLRLEGAEYFWPLNFLAIPSRPQSGSVNPSTKTAVYRMPMAGTECDCMTFLDRPEGYIDVILPGLNGRFSLTSESQKKLAERLG